MLNELVSYDKKPAELHINSCFRKVAQNASFGCRRTKSAGYYDETVNKTFYCWNGEGMDVWVGAFDHATGQFDENHLVVVNNMKTTWDYHNYPVMVQAPDGSPLIFYCRHSSEMYQLTGKPHSVSDGFELKTISTDLTCYPYAVKAQEDIYVFYSRNDDLSHPYRSLNYIKSGDSGKTWEPAVTVVDSQKADPQRFDEVYMCDACYLPNNGPYPDRIQFTWSMWGGPNGHASQGQGAYLAYLSLEDLKVYSPAGKCMSELLGYHDMIEHCQVSLVPATSEVSHSVQLIASSALPETGAPIALVGGNDETGAAHITCHKFNGVSWDVSIVEEGVRSLHDLCVGGDPADLSIAYFVGPYAVTRRYDGGKWTLDAMAEIPFEEKTDSVTYINFIHGYGKGVIGFLAKVELAQSHINYEGVWPVYLWIQEP